MGKMIHCFYTLYEKNENWKNLIKKFARKKKIICSKLMSRNLNLYHPTMLYNYYVINKKIVE